MVNLQVRKNSFDNSSDINNLLDDKSEMRIKDESIDVCEKNHR